MLRYSCFCRMYKGLFYCSVESGAFHLGACPQAMHTSAAVHTEYESQEERALCGSRKIHRSAEKDSEAMAKLHIPVMVDEVIHCLTPRKGQQGNWFLYRRIYMRIQCNKTVRREHLNRLTFFKFSQWRKNERQDNISELLCNQKKLVASTVQTRHSDRENENCLVVSGSDGEPDPAVCAEILPRCVSGEDNQPL